MAWRIEDSVSHGVIDNTVEGWTTGRIWLAGRERPLVLLLEGDCWRDLAGTRLQFRNPRTAVESVACKLEEEQKGVVGDMTVSRRSKVPVTEGERLFPGCGEIPFRWRNALYVEWFSEANGRVVIESPFFDLEISEHQWTMDEDEEEAQKLANLNSMRDFMAQVIRRREPADFDESPEELDEFAWEERLKESDRLTDAYQEVMEKYQDDVDCERKEAFVMGWDGLLDALAEREEAGMEADHPGSPVWGNLMPEEKGTNASGGIPFDEEDSHPLQRRAQELAFYAMEVVDQKGSPGTPSYRMVTGLLQVSGKLAGALNGRSNGYEPETGFVLAVLKRCLHWLNEAVGACQELHARETEEQTRQSLDQVAALIFSIRGSIVELRRELKQS